MSADEGSGRMRRGCVVPGLLVLVAAGAVDAGQIDTATYGGLRRGMTESEVLVRAGPPDMVSRPGEEAVVWSVAVERRRGEGEVTHRRHRVIAAVVERWHWIPGPEAPDPYLTVITFRGGEVWERERTKVFSRHAGPTSPPSRSQERADPTPPPSDHDVRLRRAERTVEAAEHYSRTRERLLEQAEPADPPPPSEVFSGVAPDGSTWFGDRPPPAPASRE
ncbi:MAG: hypothetical protein H6983_16090 [Ectothiorhodospiraceae bacterium]|nr:hypothetical protein [Ectothiorhodospiraceae bacterium]